jgi:peptide/nickel transport system substrate-binding protein
MALSASGQRISQLITPGLLTFDDACRPVPDLAESFVWPDERTVEFRLRQNLRFHDGSSLTAEDVVATFESVMDPRLGSPRRRAFERITRVEAVDARTVRFHLDEPFRPLLAELSLGILPRALARSGAEVRAPVGAGPFQLAAPPGRDAIQLVPFMGFHRDAPKVRSLTIRVVRDETARVLELLDGQADLLIGGLSPAILPAVRRERSLSVVTAPGTGLAYLVPNVRGGPTADPRVRRALCHAVDRASIVRHKLSGLARPAQGFLPETHWAYAPVPGCAYDPARAERLLDEAGFPRRGPDGLRLHLTLKTSTDRLRRTLGLVLQAELRAVGVSLEVQPLEFGVFFRDVNHGNFELAQLKWASVIEPDLMRRAFASSQVPEAANGFTGFNRGGFRDGPLDALLERAAVVDPASRAALYAQAQAMEAEALPVIPLWHEDVVSVVSSRVRGYHPSAHGFFRPLAEMEEVAP